MEQQPICYIIAGANGAGKTTFALNFLPSFVHCRNFINADMIAAGLSPLNPESMTITAGRLFLKEMRQFIQKRESFGLETTLSGKSYLSIIQILKQNGWRIELYYLWLPSIEFSAKRVEERVKHGGHNIPLQDIQRRYPKSIDNLLNHYAPLCDLTVCMDNSTLNPETIFIQEDSVLTVINASKFEQIKRKSSCKQ
jgi:predicted ABC-type ATPase